MLDWLLSLEHRALAYANSFPEHMVATPILAIIHPICKIWDILLQVSPEVDDDAGKQQNPEAKQPKLARKRKSVFNRGSIIVISKSVKVGMINHAYIRPQLTRMCGEVDQRVILLGRAASDVVYLLTHYSSLI